MGTVNFLWNAVQQFEIDEAKHEARDAKFDARVAVHDELLPHAQRLDRLALVCRAMWILIREKTGLTERDLLEMVTELDLRDGVADHKYTKPPLDCPKCGAKMCRKFNRCLFCGEPCPDASAFDAV